MALKGGVDGASVVSITKIAESGVCAAGWATRSREGGVPFRLPHPGWLSIKWTNQMYCPPADPRPLDWPDLLEVLHVTRASRSDRPLL
jgi:hypothetical protein